MLLAECSSLEQFKIKDFLKQFHAMAFDIYTNMSVTPRKRMIHPALNLTIDIFDRRIEVLSGIQNSEREFIISNVFDRIYKNPSRIDYFSDTKSENGIYMILHNSYKGLDIDGIRIFQSTEDVPVLDTEESIFQNGLLYTEAEMNLIYMYRNFTDVVIENSSIVQVNSKYLHIIKNLYDNINEFKDFLYAVN